MARKIKIDDPALAETFPAQRLDWRQRMNGELLPDAVHRCTQRPELPLAGRLDDFLLPLVRLQTRMRQLGQNTSAIPGGDLDVPA